MSRFKRSSRELEKARKRLAGIESIDPSLDLGNGLTVSTYGTKITEINDAINNHNQLMSQADASTSHLNELERALGQMSELILESVAVKFGHDSFEYEKAGGVRKSERKRPVREPKKAA